MRPQALSGFYENLPGEQIVENRFKDIIQKNYSLSGFTPLDTPAIERIDTLLSKGGDDNEIYAVRRVKAEEGTPFELGLRFDLTLPLARYIAQHEGVLTFPFKRQQIGKSWRGERPQKGRFREFYQADIDIIGNGEVSLFGDVEIITTIYNTLSELNFGNFVIHLNNKKILCGFLESIGILKVAEVISIIDKKDKVESIVPFLGEYVSDKNQIDAILELIEISKIQDNERIFAFFSSYMNNESVASGIADIQYVYQNLLHLGVDKQALIFNPSISRGLNYYTGLVFETFIVGYEQFGSISSGGRYDNLCANFTSSSFPGVGGSIGLSRLLSVLKEIGKIDSEAQHTVSKVLVANMGNDVLKDNLELVKYLRGLGIATEIYLDENAKLVKQLKYANNKKIPYVLIQGGQEKEQGIIQLKILSTGEQKNVKKNELIEIIER